jgi:2-haloacid dehalogenase
MPDRRDFLALLLAGAGCARGSSGARPPPSARTIRAVAFDAFPIFDPRPLFARLEESFPGRGTQMAAIWRDRQFEYAWLRSMAGQYADFWQVTEDALEYAASVTGVDLHPTTRQALMEGYLALKPWPDAVAALRAMRAGGLRLAFLSNFTPAMLRSCVRASALDGVFEHVISTDEARAFKPDPRAYRLAVDAFGVQREEIAFVAFAAWDAAGAKWFGYETFWVNRLGLPAERLGAEPDTTTRGLEEVARALATG